MTLTPREWRLHWWNRSLWWRTYHQSGFDGYRTITGRKLACATMDTALKHPGMRDEIRALLAAQRAQRKPLRQRLRLRAEDTAHRLAMWLDDRDHDKAAGRLYGLSKKLGGG